MKVLYIGGTGEISYSCVQLGVALGQEIHVFNRGRSEEPLPTGVKSIIGDLANPASYAQLAHQTWDVICQFKVYTPAEAQRDIDLFSGKCGQYLFISSASAYRKPPTTHLITESIPLENPFWPYSQSKADCEKLLLQSHADRKLPVTIVRPSHTFRRNFPTPLLGGDNVAWRLTNHKPILIPGDGNSLWTITHADDFAKPFTRLLGHPKSLGQAYHITAHLRSYSWNQIVHAIAAALGIQPTLVHVPTDTLLRFNPDWTGPLLGDKANSVLFDNTKIRSLVGAFPCDIDLQKGMSLAAPHVKKRLLTFTPDPNLHTLADQIASSQQSLSL